ncbi:MULTISPECIES: hypothetical protein [Burkholderia cepacia complex]|uniref:hypothetical protein n=1 Tax=Burkholderia cepacia complex TaxID=87882 RepID=UPI001B9998EE|nr:MULTISPECIES: hypothetical protein [Burkholderia cepacia complex]MBR8084588.1 hypothetical protein [Burkholderia vietnamiensis]
MNDQQQSRADALTEAQRKALETAVNVLNINWEHETANELWEAFTAPVSQPAAEPIDAPSVNETITYSGDSLTLSGAQLLEALDFIAPDRDADQLESEVTIQYGEGHTGKGMYCWCTEYPEEGAIFIDGSTAIPTEAAPAPSPADERAAFEYDDVVSICDAHGICLPVDCVEMVVEIVKRSGLLAARAASANETEAEGIRAWETADGRVMTDEQKRRALAEGGATATAARPYSIPLWRFGEAPAMAAAAPADERATGMPEEVRDSLMDSRYLAGVTAGWNAANADDPNAALKKIHDAYSGYLKPLRDWQKAGRPGAHATPTSADQRAAKISDYLNAPGMWAQVYCCAVFVRGCPSDVARSAADAAVKEFGDTACKTVGVLAHTLDEVLRVN